MNKTTAAALTLAALTALTLTGILVHGTTDDPRQDETGVTSPPRTVVMAAPEPCPHPYPLAICAPIPPAPLWGAVPEVPLEGVAAEYAAAWAEVGR